MVSWLRFAVVACSVLGVSCDCGGGATVPDATVPDACGNWCGCGTIPRPCSLITDPEGGNVIVEYQHLDTELQAALGLPTGVTTRFRGIAYVMSAMTPDAEALPTLDQCKNLDVTHGWPIGVGMPHTDVDVGPSIDLVGSRAAGTTTISLARQPAVRKRRSGSSPVATLAGVDELGRPHDVYYQTALPGADAYLTTSAPYTVQFAGDGTTIGATTFQAGLFVPADFALTTPGLEDDGPLVAGTDFPVAWTPGNSTNLPVEDSVAELIWLIDVMGHPTHLCVAAHDAGTFTIPGATIAEYVADATARGTDPTRVILARQAIVHRFKRLPLIDTANIRRFDMLGVVSWLQLMNVQ